jgi:hypothetical protein
MHTCIIGLNYQIVYNAIKESRVSSPYSDSTHELLAVPHRRSRDQDLGSVCMTAACDYDSDNLKFRGRFKIGGFEEK